jgi:peptidyl-prolyl cis-trans isomerase SurA
LLAGSVALLAHPALTNAQAKPVVVEEIVARVDNEMISLSDYQKADAALHQEIAQQCQACPPDKIQADYKEQQKNLLRDLIDQHLLVARAKDMNISVERTCKASRRRAKAK